MFNQDVWDRAIELLEKENEEMKRKLYTLESQVSLLEKSEQAYGRLEPIYFISIYRMTILTKMINEQVEYVKTLKAQYNLILEGEDDLSTD